MASTFRPLSIKTLTLFIVTIFFSLPNAVSSVPSQELESMLAVLRSRGYSLFPNAIATSDLYMELLSAQSLTLFAPTDSALFALDMTQTASSYTLALRFHALPRRLSLADLRSLPSPASLPTLLPSRALHVSLRPPDIISVDGIDVVFPGLYYGRHVAVHGLGGILSFRSSSQSGGGSPPPPVSSSNHNSNSRVNRTTLFPVPKITPGNHTRHTVLPPEPKIPSVNRTDSTVSPPVPASHTSMFPPVNRTVLAPVPEPLSIDAYSPADLPGYELSPKISPGPQLQQSEHRMPATPPPSMGDVNSDGDLGPMRQKFDMPEIGDGDRDESEVKDGCSGAITVGDEAIKPEKSGPSDGETVDCQVTSGDL